MIDYKWIMALLNKTVDGFIFYSRHMQDSLETKRKPFKVIEGAASLSTPLHNHRQKEITTTTKYFLYSGSLQAEYGLQTFLEGFCSIQNENIRAVFTGSGPGKSILTDFTKKDRRVIYLGYLHDALQLESLQYSATSLINLRDPHHPSSRNVFPSKIFEYLLTGKPVISYRLASIPDDYSPYIRWIDMFTPQATAETLLSVLNSPQHELNEAGQAAKLFVQNTKNGKVQSQKLIEFANTLW